MCAPKTVALNLEPEARVSARTWERSLYVP
jgi:hypothetical protein